LSIIVTTPSWCHGPWRSHDPHDAGDRRKSKNEEMRRMMAYWEEDEMSVA
jgi:hypothetical protein